MRYRRAAATAPPRRNAVHLDMYINMSVLLRLYLITSNIGTIMAHSTHTAEKSHAGFYAFMGLLVAGFLGILGLLVWLIMQA
jgi:hypothetical protein